MNYRNTMHPDHFNTGLPTDDDETVGKLVQSTTTRALAPEGGWVRED